MNFSRVTSTFFAPGQITEADVARAAQEGFRAIIDCRPDGEEAHQPSAAEIAAVAMRHRMAFVHIPVTPGDIDDEDVARMKNPKVAEGGSVA